MPRGKLSAAAKRRIGEAAKRRWAAYRAAKDRGMPVGNRPGRKPGAKRGPGRPPGSGSAWTPARRAAQGRMIRAAMARRRRGAAGMSTSGGELGAMSPVELVRLRQRIDAELAERMIRQHSA